MQKSQCSPIKNTEIKDNITSPKIANPTSLAPRWEWVVWSTRELTGMIKYVQRRKLAPGGEDK